jgi:hypothetical protein
MVMSLAERLASTVAPAGAAVRDQYRLTGWRSWLIRELTTVAGFQGLIIG